MKSLKIKTVDELCQVQFSTSQLQLHLYGDDPKPGAGVITHGVHVLPTLTNHVVVFTVLNHSQGRTIITLDIDQQWFCTVPYTKALLDDSPSVHLYGYISNLIQQKQSAKKGKSTYSWFYHIQIRRVPYGSYDLQCILF